MNPGSECAVQFIIRDTHARRQRARAQTGTYEAVRARVQAVDHANVDETGWKQVGERRWLWVEVTALCTVFVVARNRSAAVLATVLGESFAGIVSSDRYRAYLSIPISSPTAHQASGGNA
jgi:hypothetical protein